MESHQVKKVSGVKDIEARLFPAAHRFRLDHLD